MSSGTNDAENRSDPQQPIEAVKPSGLVSKLLNATTVLIAAVFFITLAAGSITALHLKAEADAQHPIAPPVGVTTERIKIVNGYDRVAHYTGRLEPARETDLAFERTGLVTRMARDEGDSIRKGEVVANRAAGCRSQTARSPQARTQDPARTRRTHAWAAVRTRKARLES